MNIQEKAEAFVRNHENLYGESVFTDVVKNFEKNAYQAGYKQSLMDNAYDWEDIRQIIVIADDLTNEWGTAKMEEEGQETFYEEVLKRFHIKKECGL